MKKIWKILVIVSTLLIVVAGVWWYRMQPSPPSDKTVAAITKTKDERLSKGESTAPVQMIEYIDMFCSSCARAHLEVLPKIQLEYIDSGKLHYEVRVVAKIDHPAADDAAEGAYCAAEQDKFWGYIDQTYEQTARLFNADSDPKSIKLFSGVNLRSFARDVGVNVPEWENCVKQDRYSDVIAKNEKDLSALNGYGTPHSVINGENYNGAPPYRTFRAVIEAALKKTEKQQKEENK